MPQIAPARGARCFSPSRALASGIANIDVEADRSPTSEKPLSGIREPPQGRLVDDAASHKRVIGFAAATLVAFMIAGFGAGWISEALSKSRGPPPLDKATLVATSTTMSPTTTSLYKVAVYTWTKRGAEAVENGHLFMLEEWVGTPKAGDVLSDEYLGHFEDAGTPVHECVAKGYVAKSYSLTQPSLSAPTAAPTAAPIAKATAAPTPEPTKLPTPKPTPVPPSPSAKANTTCSERGKNCVSSKCCRDPGMQCYAKDEYFATCAETCVPGVSWFSDWTKCKKLGHRAPVKHNCSWTGDSCMVTKSCCYQNMKCVKKNDVEAYCTGEETPHNWNGTVIGYSRGQWEVKPVVGAEASRGSSLFCFMAVLPGSPEEQLHDVAKSKGGSIYGCDEHAVFDSSPSQKAKKWNSVLNTKVFIGIWRKVKQIGKYKNYDWTVKVDPDSVFLPDRLKHHLDNLHAPRYMPIYIKNVDQLEQWHGFLGPIEIFSYEALDKYFAEGIDEHCLQEVGNSTGEDGFMHRCMDMIGAGFMKDVSILKNPLEKDCTSSDRVCFHSFKDADGWGRCWDTAHASAPAAIQK